MWTCCTGYVAQGVIIVPLCGSILQVETCQILSLAENPRWSRVWQYIQTNIQSQMWNTLHLISFINCAFLFYKFYQIGKLLWTKGNLSLNLLYKHCALENWQNDIHVGKEKYELAHNHLPLICSHKKCKIPGFERKICEHTLKKLNIVKYDDAFFLENVDTPLTLFWPILQS